MAVPGIPPGRRLSRTAALAFSAALSAAGCGATVSTEDAAASATDSATPDSATPDSAVDDTPVSYTLYGGPTRPPEDAGVATMTDSGPPDNGGIHADYGAPPRPDAG